MFRNFANVWTPAIRASALGRKPVGATIGGERVVFFRGTDGVIGALMDRCPHRGAALSGGRVTSDSTLECPFHGWQFDRAGANCRVPLNPDAKRSQLNAVALPVRQLGELVWLYTGAMSAPPEPVVPDSLVDTDLVRTYTERTWQCHWTRAMENMLDSPHLPFVHRRTIGRSLRRRMHEGSRMDIDWQAEPWGGRAHALIDGHDNGAYLEFFRPNIMVLRIPVPGRHLHIHALVIPLAEGQTRLLIVQSRDFARAAMFNPLFGWVNARIAAEDKDVVESAGTAEVPSAAEEKSVPTDRATLQFRKYYYEELRTQ